MKKKNQAPVVPKIPAKPQVMAPKAAPKKMPNLPSAAARQAELKRTQSQPTGGSIEEVMPLTKVNYMMMGVCLLLIAVGFFLMGGSSNEGSTFNSDVFSSTRIVVAPFITFVGFILMVPSILWRVKNKKEVD